MSQLRDITDSDPGRGGRGRRLLVIGAAAVVLAATVLAATPRPVHPATTTFTPPPLPRSTGLLGAAFPDPAHGWLLTGDGLTGGRLWRTGDGGASWENAFQVDADSRVGGLELGAAGTGYLAVLGIADGLGSTGLWLTGDGGQTFVQHGLPDPAGFRLLGLSTAADGSAHALFSDELFPPTGLVYGRSGESWTLDTKLLAASAQPATPLLGSRTAVAFLDAQTGLVATQTTDGLGVYRTADGGRTWTLHQFGPPPDGEQLPPAAVSLTAVGGQVLLAADYPVGTEAPAAYLFTSRDGGASWSPAEELPTSDGLETPAFVSPTTWWIPFGKAVLVTTDAGAHWFRGGLELPGTTAVTAVYPIDGRRAWAFGGASPGPPQLLYETVDGGADWKVVRPPG